MKILFLIYDNHNFKAGYPMPNQIYFLLSNKKKHRSLQNHFIKMLFKLKTKIMLHKVNSEIAEMACKNHFSMTKMDYSLCFCQIIIQKIILLKQLIHLA